MLMPLRLLAIRDSDRINKKYKAIFNDGTVVHFGARGYEDYTMHRDEDRKNLYLKRHRKNENWNNPKTAGALSRFLLWNKPTLRESLNDYKRRFNV